MADDLSLLFRLRADNAQAKATINETKAAVTALRSSFGNDFSQMQGAAKTALADIGNNLNAFVGARLPLVGGAFVRVTQNIGGLHDELRKGGPDVKKLADQIDAIGKVTGKTSSEITKFLTSFVKLEGQAKRDAAALDFVGTAAASKLIPQLDAAGESMTALAVESSVATSALAGIAIPIAAGVVAAGALALGLAALGKELFEVTKQASDFQGKMFDLSQQTGVTVETLSALEVAAKTTGGSIESVSASLGIFQKHLEEADDPASKSAKRFREIGVSAKDTETALRQTVAALARMPEGAQQTAIALELFGRGGRQVLAILKETNGDLDAFQQKLRDAGLLISTDAARAADKFNDELELLNFQVRAVGADLAKELIPAMLESIKALSDLLRAGRPVAELLGRGLRPVVSSAASALRGLSIVVTSLTGDYVGLARAIKEANEAVRPPPIEALTNTGVQPVPLPGQPSATDTAKEIAQQSDAILAEAKRIAAVQKQIRDDAFQRGRIARQQEAEDTIATSKRVLDAEKQSLQTKIDLKEQEIKELDRGTDAYEKAAEDIRKLQQQQLDAENLFNVTSREIRARAAKERADNLRNQAQNETDIVLSEIDRQIKGIEAAIDAGLTTEASGLSTIEQLERAKVELRRESLEQQKQIGFLTIQNQQDINAQIQKLDQEADRLVDEQQTRRIQREKLAGERIRDLKLAEIDTLIQLQQIAGERTIASIQALAEARVKTEEQAAREILQIRLDLIDQEIEATNAKLAAAAGITDASERAQAQADLTNQIRIFNETRKTIEASGNRDVEAARQTDLENERKYARELLRIRDEILDTVRETNQLIIEDMIRHHARRIDIIRAQADIDVSDEEDRHSRELEAIEKQRQENRESNRTQEEKNEKTEELNRLEEAEAERHRNALNGIKDQQKTDEQEISPFGPLGIDVDGFRELARQVFEAFADPLQALGELFDRLQLRLQQFADEVQSSVVPLGEILTRAFLDVAGAIGQTVFNWVLLGETGPAVMRKIVAQALASIAAEAAVNAIKELAVGFALLAVGDFAGAGNAFISAGLWGAIGGVAAIAGRSVAGDLFKQKTGSTGSTGKSGPDQINPVTLDRNPGQPPQPININVRVQQDRHSIVEVFTDDFRANGKTRQVVNQDGGPI